MTRRSGRSKRKYAGAGSHERSAARGGLPCSCAWAWVRLNMLVFLCFDGSGVVRTRRRSGCLRRFQATIVGGKLFVKSFPPRPLSETSWLLQPCRPLPAGQAKVFGRGSGGNPFFRKVSPGRGRRPSGAGTTRRGLEPICNRTRGGSRCTCARSLPRPNSLVIARPRW